MLRFLHLSDIHFDAVYGRYPEVVRSALKSGIKKAFEGAINFAIEEGLDFIIIAGDLCDRSEVSYQTERFLRKQFSRLDQAASQSYYFMEIMILLNRLSGEIWEVTYIS